MCYTKNGKQGGYFVEIVRQPEVVEAFHYDLQLAEKTATEIKVAIQPVDMSQTDEFPAESNSVVGLRIEFLVGFDEFSISGSVRQLVTLIGKKIEKPEECTPEELNELVAPLFSIIQRLTYEVTEIALDRPGIQLNFEQN